MSTAQRPILFAGRPGGVLNPLPVLVGKLARRGVPDLWFAAGAPRRADVQRLTDRSPVEFASLGEVFSGLSAVSWTDEDYRRSPGPRGSRRTEP